MSVVALTRAPHSKVRGIGLFRLIVTGLIFSLVLSVGFPVLYSYLQMTRLHTASNSMTAALIGARMVAVQQNKSVILCSTVDGRHCDNQGTWEQGILFFVDQDKNGHMNGMETPLKVFPALNNGATIRSDYADAYKVVYLPSGQVQSTDRFNVCINNVPESGRMIDVNLTGRPFPKAGANQCPGDGSPQPSSMVAMQ